MTTETGHIICCGKYTYGVKTVRGTDKSSDKMEQI